MSDQENYTEGLQSDQAEEDLFDQIKKTRLVAASVWFLITTLGLAGNGFVIFTIIKYKQMTKNSTICYLLNLTISNISYLLCCVLVTALTYVIESWPFGRFLCKSYHYLSFVN